MTKRSIFSLLTIILFLVIALLYWSAQPTEEIFTRSTLYNIEDLETVDFKAYDSVELSTSDLYKADAVKKVIQGEQYRAAWSTKIKVPIVFLDTLKGGMSIVEKGGGKQTHSLELLGVGGISYTLRSVNKDVNPLIPQFLKTLHLENIVVDGISAQHPLAAVLVAELADKAEVLHTHPQLVFVPKQKTLGNYNQEFGNRLFLLEYETKSDVNYTPHENVMEIMDTDNLQELKLELKDSLVIDEGRLVRSRLFDLLIGDWDRHTKQWGWAVQKQDRIYNAIPVAGDRDNAFFNADGLIPKLLSNKHIVKELRPFEKDIDYMEGLVYPFDVYFLSQTSESTFLEQAKTLQALLTDQKLEQALKVWPSQISALDGEAIVMKIKERRNNLLDYAKEFHTIIQKKELLKAPLKGSEDLDLNAGLLSCFQCADE
ncbi:MAG: hypothetical protein ABJQ39_06105 [Winogradskyella arenosi]